MDMLQPENPSERFPFEQVIYKCGYCGSLFADWKLFTNHMENLRHRVCYKCGMNCGSMKEWSQGLFVVEQKKEGNVVTFYYKHVECPITNPSKRK